MTKARLIVLGLMLLASVCLDVLDARQEYRWPVLSRDELIAKYGVEQVEAGE